MTIEDEKNYKLDDWFTKKISITVVYPDLFKVIPQSFNNDLAEGEDRLNIKHEVEALAEILVMNKLEPPLAVGIFGGWGSGKSYAMHLIQQKITQIRCQRLNEEQAWNDDAHHVGHIYQIRFDAWTYTRSNLWASLMQTIFFELNRQLTLEKQLKNAGFSPLPGGKIWEALNEMSDEERKTLLKNKIDSQQLDSLQEPDLLLDYLKTSNEKEVEVLKTQEDLLQKEKEKNEDLKKKTRDKVAAQKTQISSYIFPMKTFLTKAMGSALKDLENEVKDTIPKDRQLNDQDIEKIQSILTDFRLNKLFTWKGIKKWMLSNWELFLGFGILTILTILTPILLSRITKQLIPQIIASLVALIPTITTATVLFKNFLRWYASVEESFKDYQKQVKDYQNNIVQSQAKKTEEEISQSKDIQESENKIKQLEAQIVQQKQRINIVNYVSLDDFVTTQITTGLYEKRLGLLHQVKNDLAILTENLTLPKKRDKRYEEKKKRLKDIFPRGEARVILYIDDLDRCPPKRVVEVLEAVQLLLKTPLFVVVLAIDDRYVARALEKVYEGVLKRGGNPSGIDYIEKIIQIPYRMRLISQSGIESYLTPHMEIEEDENIPNTQKKEERKNAEKVGIESIEEKQPILEPKNNQTNTLSLPSQSETSSNSEITEDEDNNQVTEDKDNNQVTEDEDNNQVTSTSVESNDVFSKKDEELPSQVVKFTKEEFNTLKNCCQQVDLSPRTVKRLINIYKILKIIWFRLKQQKKHEVSKEVKEVIIACLSLSGRYPNLMRNVFAEIEICFEEQKEQNVKLIDIFCNKQSLSDDVHSQREWNKFIYDVKKLIPRNLNLEQLKQENFSLVLSFCFVADIGYDPTDFVSINKKRQESPLDSNGEI